MLQQRFTACLLLVLLLVATPTVGLADSNKRRARKLFKQGNTLFERGLLLDALRKYRAARELYPSHKIDLNIGGTLDALGRRTEAAAYFEKFLLEATTAPPKIIAVARGRLVDLKKKLGSVRISCSEDGAVVAVDGAIVGKTPRYLPVYVEPGRHRFSVLKEGFIDVTLRLTFTAGDHRKSAVVLKTRGDEPAKPVTVVSKPSPVKPDNAAARTHRKKTVGGLIALGVGGAALAAAAVMYGLGASQGSSAHEDYKSYESYSPQHLAANNNEAGNAMSAAYDDVEAAKTKLIVGHVLAGVAVAAGGVAIYQLLTRPDLDAPQPDERKTAFSFTPLPGGGAATLLTTF